jgi:hypothetical protein
VTELQPGDYVVATVRRPGSSIYDRIGICDMTTGDVYFERGESAAVLCDRVLAGGLLRGVSIGWRDRMIPAEHFDFRGGEQQAHRPRREDR